MDIYEHVNKLWPKELPPLTEPEAAAAVRRLYRKALGKPWRGPVEITSGNRYTWVRRGVFYVNASAGWHELVHHLSHYCRNRLARQAGERRGHSAKHAYLERDLVQYVLDSGWLQGSLRKPEPPKPTRAETRDRRRAERYRRILARIVRAKQQIAAAEKTAKRARRRLARLNKSADYYARQSYPLEPPA